jgi:hypothetical protein
MELRLQVYIFNPNRPWKQQKLQPPPALQTPLTLFVVNSCSRDGRHLVGQAGTLAGDSRDEYP